VGKTMPITVAQFDDVLGRLEDGLRELARVARQIIVNCKDLLRWLGPLAAQVEQMLARFGELMRRIFSELGKFMTRPGHPAVLWTDGDRWITEVGIHAGNRVGTLTPDFMHSDDRWKGSAADAYLRALPPQKLALEKVQAVSNQLGDSLHEIAVAVGTFWVAVAAAVTSFLAELLGASGVTATGVGVAVGVAAAVASALKFTTAFATLAGGLTAFLGISLRAQTQLDRELADNAPFAGPPAGHWPASTSTDLNDGSMSDGNDSDWHLSY
jgi:hypothetical protein